MGYSLDFNKIIRRYLATWFRPVRYAWLSSLVSPLYISADNMFVKYRQDALERANYNCQTIVLQEVLNKILATGSPNAIYIKNADEFVEQVYINNEAEGYEGVPLNNEGSGEPLFIFNEYEFAQTFDFVVYVPQSVYNQSLDLVKSIVNRYKLAGMKYQIIYY